VQQIITCYNGDSSYPVLLRHDLVSVLPYLKKKYLKYENYREQTIGDIFTPEQLSQAIRLEANIMESSVFINNKNGTFTRISLPEPAQVSIMYGVNVDDFDGDGNKDILMGGNLFEAKPEVGIYDASYGIMLKGDGKGGFTPLTANQSGINLRGAIRDIISLSGKKNKILLFARNNDSPVILTTN
jgi:hypothetical protein